MFMKTLNLPAIAGAALTALAINLSAGDAVLTPRARDNQIKTVPATTTTRNLATENWNITATPRSLDNKPTTAGAVETRNLALGACAIGTPRQVERTGKTASASCCQPVVTGCTARKACCAGN
jgi:hypothetical protein